MAHQTTSRNWVKYLIQIHRSHIKPLAHRKIFLLQLADDKDCICCASAWNKIKLECVNRHHLPYESVSNPLYAFHSQLCQIQSSMVASVQSITLSLTKSDNEALLPVSWDLPISNDCSGKVKDHGST